VAVTPQSRQADPKTTVFLLGVATVVAQAILLREAMAAMGGSELAWGTVMALWLLGMGLGARIGANAGSPRLAHILPTLVLVASGTGVVLFRAAPALIGTASGESITTASAIWLWVAAVLPAAFAGGLAFPILASSLGSSGGGRAYAIEAAGALVGGAVLSVTLMAFGTTVALCLAVSFVAAASLWRRSRAAAILIAIAGMVLASPLAESLARAGWSWSRHPGELHAWRETRLQRLEVTRGPPTTIFADGRLVASYPDPYEVLPKAHLVMLLHPGPRRILAVGCVADGSVEAMARHPLEMLMVVEDDPALIRHIPEWYGPALARALTEPHVQVAATDPLRALAGPEPWDLVILRDGNPTTLRRNRTRTVEFLRRCRAHMSPDGILVIRVAVADTYLGGAAGRLLATLATTTREVFPQVEVVPGGEILLVAGGSGAELDLDPAVLANRMHSREIDEPELIPEMIPVLVDRERAGTLAAHLEAEAGINTIAHPRAVLTAGGLHEGRSNPTMLRYVLALEQRSGWPLAVALGIAVAILIAMAFTRIPPVSSTAAAVGFTSMGWWLLLIGAWQATRGSVYSEVGALTALFMAGIAGGAAAATRWTAPAQRLPRVLAAGAALSLLIAAGIAHRIPLGTVPLLLIAGGALTGAAFPAVTALSRRGVRRGAGIAFAADEAGAAAGALVVGIVSVSWVGIGATALGLAILSVAAIPAVGIALRRS
jgi:predicted membrane-bound spermidine synthase